MFSNFLTLMAFFVDVVVVVVGVVGVALVDIGVVVVVVAVVDVVVVVSSLLTLPMLLSLLKENFQSTFSVDRTKSLLETENKVFQKEIVVT